MSMEYDDLLQKIADYVLYTPITSPLAYETASACLADSLGCAILALNFKECRKLLGPILPDNHLSLGAQIPGTHWKLDPITAAFNLGAMIRWLDFNDTWLAAEWGHPSDNIGGILTLADYISKQRVEDKKEPLKMKEVLTAIIKAYEIQGILALENSFNRVGLDHVILVKVATTAIASYLLGGSRTQIMDAVSQAWIDSAPLRTYRHAPNTGSRKSWAAGDATSRGVRLAWLTKLGEKGYPQALSAKKWGFSDVFFQGKPIQLGRPLGSYVIENILFKISFPAEFHAQTAVEAAITLHESIKDRLHEIEKIEIHTHESAIRIIDKTGPLHNPADRDHCLQYMVAVGLLLGDLKAEHYEDLFAKEQKALDELRQKMIVAENQQFSVDYLDPKKRSIANALQVRFKDGSQTPLITVEYPLGHRFRREEGKLLLQEKLQENLETQFSKEKVGRLMALFDNLKVLEEMPVSEFTKHFQN